MAIKSKDDILKSITTILGDRTDDDALNLIEDITDTVNDYESKISDTTNWKKKYEDNDAEWRKKYKDRFMNGSVDNDTDPNGVLIDDDTEPPKALKFEDLFETK